MGSTIRVRVGDSPMGLARAFTDDPARAHELIEANPHKPRVNGTFVGLTAGEQLIAPTSWSVKAFGRVTVSASQVRGHVLNPPNVLGALCDIGRDRVEPVVVGGAALAYSPGRAVVQLPKNVFGRLSGFNPTTFTASIAKLRSQTNGYAMELRQNGAPIASDTWGFADRYSNAGGLGWTLDTPQHIGSVSKLFTAIAMVKLLRERVISVDRPILPFLPSYWDTGPNIERVTFRMLLQHKSGFNDPDPTQSWRPDLSYTKSQVASGVNASAIGTYAYRNINFALCRYLHAVVAGNMDPKWVSASGMDDTDRVWDLVSIKSLGEYTQDSVFVARGPTYTRRSGSAYGYTWPIGGGWDSGDLSVTVGAAGWHMSVREILDVLGTLRRTPAVLPRGVFEAEVLGPQFGIDQIISTALGITWDKGGLWQHSGDGQFIASSLFTEQAAAFVFPLGMELAMLVNSPIGPGAQGLQAQVLQAFMDAITSP